MADLTCSWSDYRMYNPDYTCFDMQIDIIEYFWFFFCPEPDFWIHRNIPMCPDIQLLSFRQFHWIY